MAAPMEETKYEVLDKIGTFSTQPLNKLGKL